MSSFITRTLIFFTSLTQILLYAAEKPSNLPQNNRQIMLWQAQPLPRLHIIFSDDQERIIRHSFSTQKRDAKLIDYTGLLGGNWIFTQAAEKISKPFLYRLSKNDKVGYLLGSCHCVPLSFYSEEFLDIVKGCQNFIGESSGAPPLSRKYLEKAGLTIDPNKEGWFDNLDSVIQTYLNYVFESKNSYLAKEIKLQELALPMAYLLYYTSAQQGIAMDIQIEALFPKNNVYNLETFEESLRPVLDDIARPSSLAKWQEELYDNIYSGQGIMDNEFKNLILDYKQGSITLEARDLYKDSALTIRNRNWMRSWHNYFSDLDMPLFCVGAAHLFGKYGLLNLLLQDGYSIKYDYGLPLPVCEVFK